MADHPDATSEDLAEKKKDLMGKFNPIMVRVYEEAGVSKWSILFGVFWKTITFIIIWIIMLAIAEL